MTPKKEAPNTQSLALENGAHSLLGPLFENVPDCCYIHDLNGEFKACNRAAESMLGLNRKQVTGTNFTSCGFLQGESLQLAFSLLEENKKGHAVGPVELELTLLSGRRITVEVRNYPVQLEGTIYVLGIARDITGRKEREERERKLIHDLCCLAHTANQYVGLSSKECMYDLISEQLRRLIPEAIVVVNSYESRTDSLVTRAVSGLGDTVSKVRSLIGGEITGMVFTLDDRAREELSKGKMVEVPGGLYDFCFGRIPRSIVGVLEKMWGVKHVYTAGIRRSGRLFGNLAVMVENELDDEDMEVLNAFVDQTALAVHRKSTEDRLFESNQRYKTVVESIGTGIAVIDSYFRVDSANSCMKKWFPKLIDPTGHPCISVFEPFCSSQMCKTCPVSLTLEDGEVHKRTITVQNPALPSHLRIVSSPLKDNSGHTISVVLVVEDVSDYVSHERRQREQIIFLQRLIDSIPNPVFYKDKELRIQGCNASFERFTGYSKEYAVGKTSEELGLEKTDNEALLKERKLLERPATQIYDTKEKCAEGCFRDVVYSKASYCSENGEAAGIVGVIIDITERVKTERKLAQATHLAQSAVEAKNEFIASVSHEIRTPLSAILLASEALHRTDLNSESQEYASILHESAKILMKIVNDVLDFSKIQSGKMVVEKEVFSLRDLADEIVRSFSLQAEAKKIGLVTRFDDSLPLKTLGDMGKIRQVLSNLFSNALKFTSGGEIVLTVKRVQRHSEALDLLFSVSDTGIGIHPEKHDLVFDSFTQADGSVGKRYGGAGLGLSICKHLVELMDGKIWLESEIDKGSTFYFQIRLGEYVENG